MDPKPLQYTIVTTGLRIAARCLANRWIGFALTLGLYAGLALIVTMMFVRNPSNPMLPHELHQHETTDLPFAHKSGLNARTFALFKDMVNGEAHKPYVNRVLMPWMVRTITATLDKPAIDKWAADTPRFQLAMKEIGLDWEPDFITEYLVACALFLLWLMGFAFAVRWLHRTVFKSPLWLATATGVAALLVLPPCFELYGSYIYDFSGLCLFTVGLVFLARGQWIPYLLIFALGALNKETTVLLIFAFCMWHTFSGKLPWKTFFALALLQSVLFIAIKFGIGLSFADNPGGAVEFHLFRNLSKLPRWDLATVVASGVLLLFIGWRWREHSLFLRSSLIILVPLVVLTFLFGYFDELRDYYEAFPILLLMISFNAARLLGVPMEARI